MSNYNCLTMMILRKCRANYEELTSLINMDSHLGYESNDHGPKNTENRRNGYINKTVKSTFGDLSVEVPRDRDSFFDPQIIPKRTRDVSGIEDKVLSMYAKGMSQRDIADTIEDIYGFEISHDTISSIR